MLIDADALFKGAIGAGISAIGGIAHNLLIGKKHRELLETRTLGLENQVSELRRELAAAETRATEQKRQYNELVGRLRERPVVNREYLDVIVLGPRNSGKTSLVRLWTQPWNMEPPTATRFWEVSETTIHEQGPMPRVDPHFGVERQHYSHHRLRIKDYAGEMDIL